MVQQGWLFSARSGQQYGDLQTGGEAQQGERTLLLLNVHFVVYIYIKSQLMIAIVILEVMQPIHERSWDNSCLFLSVLRDTRSEDPDLQRPDLLRQPQLLQGGDEPAAGPDAREDPQLGESQKSAGETGERGHRQHCGTTTRTTHNQLHYEKCEFLTGKRDFSVLSLFLPPLLFRKEELRIHRFLQKITSFNLVNNKSRQKRN